MCVCAYRERPVISSVFLLRVVEFVIQPVILQIVASAIHISGTANAIPHTGITGMSIGIKRRDWVLIQIFALWIRTEALSPARPICRFADGNDHTRAASAANGKSIY